MIANTGGGGLVRPVFTVTLPLRPATHIFGATVTTNVPSVVPRASLGTVMKLPLLTFACHWQFAVTATDPGAFGVRTPAVTHPQMPSRTVGGSSGGSFGFFAGVPRSPRSLAFKTNLAAMGAA